MYIRWASLCVAMGLSSQLNPSVQAEMMEVPCKLYTRGSTYVNHFFQGGFPVCVSARACVAANT
jgi:hypothetical protein